MPALPQFSQGFHQHIEVPVGVELLAALQAMAVERFGAGDLQVAAGWSMKKEAVRRLCDSVDGSAANSPAGVAALAARNVTTAQLRARLDAANSEFMF